MCALYCRGGSGSGGRTAVLAPIGWRDSIRGRGAAQDGSRGDPGAASAFFPLFLFPAPVPAAGVGGHQPGDQNGQVELPGDRLQRGQRACRRLEGESKTFVWSRRWYFMSTMAGSFCKVPEDLRAGIVGRVAPVGFL